MLWVFQIRIIGGCKRALCVSVGLEEEEDGAKRGGKLFFPRGLAISPLSDSHFALQQQEKRVGEERGREIVAII